MAPSLRGLSKIYLIFDWGSVLKSNDTPSVTAAAVPAPSEREPRRLRRIIYKTTIYKSFIDNFVIPIDSHMTM